MKTMPEPARDVLHQRRLAVARRRNEQQQAHAVGALRVARGADLLGEIVADERQVGGVDQSIADEAGEDLRLEVIEAQARAGLVHARALQRGESLIQRDDARLVRTHAPHEVEEVQRELTARDPLDDCPRDLRVRGSCVALITPVARSAENEPRRLIDVLSRVRGSGASLAKPCTHSRMSSKATAMCASTEAARCAEGVAQMVIAQVRLERLGDPRRLRGDDEALIVLRA